MLNILDYYIVKLSNCIGVTGVDGLDHLAI